MQIYFIFFYGNYINQACFCISSILNTKLKAPSKIKGKDYVVASKHSGQNTWPFADHQKAETWTPNMDMDIIRSKASWAEEAPSPLSAN